LVTTYIELIVAPRGLSSIEAGTLGGIMLIGSIVGTIILTPLSDKFHKRKIFIIISTLIAALALIGLTFASNVSMFNAFGFLLGFGLSGAGPIILEYAADVTSPVSEANSNGILMLVGQVGGIIFIMGFEKFTTPSGDYFPSLIFLSILTFIVLILTFKIKDVNKRGI
jgi:MFS family permease